MLIDFPGKNARGSISGILFSRSRIIKAKIGHGGYILVKL